MSYSCRREILPSHSHKMHDKLNSNRHLRLVTTTQASPLNLNERLVYSALLTHADGLSQAAVSFITGLDAKGTVAATVKSLAGIKLAEGQGRLWVALEPKEERACWFHPGPKAKDWRRSFGYTKLYQRATDCPLTLRQNVVYCTLLSLAAKSSSRKDLPQAIRGRFCNGLTYEYIAALTGVGVKTVTMTIGMLGNLNLSRLFPATDRSRFALVMMEPTDEALAWYVDKESESYPGLTEYLSGQDDVAQVTGTLDVAALVHEMDQGSEEGAGHRKAAKRAKAQTEKSTPKVEPERLPKEPARPEPEVLPPVTDTRLDPPDPIEIRRRQAEELRLGREHEIEAILLGYGYDDGVADKLSRAFDKPGLPAYDAYVTMIHDAEVTFQKNKSEGRYAKVRTSELLLDKRLEIHRKEALERAERNLQVHDRTVLNQRLSLVGRTALERSWEDYEDPMTAPFDARLFAERVASSELRWDWWGRDYGEQACRQAVVGLPRVRIDEVLVEDGRIEPDEFVERLVRIAPPRPLPKRMTEDEMYEAWQAGMSAVRPAEDESSDP